MDGKERGGAAKRAAEGVIIEEDTAPRLMAAYYSLGIGHSGGFRYWLASPVSVDVVVHSAHYYLLVVLYRRY